MTNQLTKPQILDDEQALERIKKAFYINRFVGAAEHRTVQRDDTFRETLKMVKVLFHEELAGNNTINAYRIFPSDWQALNQLAGGK